MPPVRQRTLPPGSVRLLRYRFESAEQVHHHFHVVQGKVVLFYPCVLSLRPGDPVLLDVTSASSEQHCSLRATVIGSESGGGHSGSWLNLVATTALAVRGALLHPKRRQRRFPTDLLVTVAHRAGMPVVGKLIDVSLGGGRISGISINVTTGDRLHLSVVAQQTAVLDITARAAWVRGSDIGVEFKPSPGTRGALAELIEASRQALAQAYEATHPSFCQCLDGKAVADPPLPRSVHRQTGSR